MQRLIAGVRAFHASIEEGGWTTDAPLADGQRPETFLACSDSRVVPAFLSTTEPGELFTVRNVGNLIPPAGPRGASTGDRSEASAIEYAVDRLGVQDIVICGHSGDGAMAALAARETYPNVKERLGTAAIRRHGWFDIRRVRVDVYEPSAGRFVDFEQAYENSSP